MLMAFHALRHHRAYSAHDQTAHRPLQSGEDWIARIDDDLSQPAEISGDLFRISALQREDPVCITLHAWIVADEISDLGGGAT